MTALPTTNLLATARALLAAWAARPAIDRIPEAGMVAATLRGLHGYRESARVARQCLTPLLGTLARDPEAVLMAAGLHPDADSDVVEAARRALAHVGDRYLRRRADVTAEVRSLQALYASRIGW